MDVEKAVKLLMLKAKLDAEWQALSDRTQDFESLLYPGPQRDRILKDRNRLTRRVYKIAKQIAEFEM